MTDTSAFENHPLHSRRRCIWTASGLLVLAVVIAGTFVAHKTGSAAAAEKGGAEASSTGTAVSQTGAVGQQAVSAAAMKTVNDSLAAMSLPSLEMRENVDFLLTPVFLARDVMATDSILTYPME